MIKVLNIAFIKYKYDLEYRSETYLHLTLQRLKVKVKVMLRLTVSQSLCLGVKFTLGLVTRYYFLSEICCVVSVGRSLGMLRTADHAKTSVAYATTAV
jgi:ABC-type uncharacterized transport system permease subunit